MDDEDGLKGFSSSREMRSEKRNKWDEEREGEGGEKILKREESQRGKEENKDKPGGKRNRESARARERSEEEGRTWTRGIQDEERDSYGCWHQAVYSAHLGIPSSNARALPESSRLPLGT